LTLDPIKLHQALLSKDEEIDALQAEVRELRGLVLRAVSDLAWARGFIETSTGEDMERLQATEAKMVEVFGPRDQADPG
jgi:hypothetical protein